MPDEAARTQWLVILHPPRPSFPADATEKEMEIVKAHFAHLEKHCDQGTVVLAGRTQEDQNPLGLVILESSDRAEAERIMREDPAVGSGLFSAEIKPFRVALLRHVSI